MTAQPAGPAPGPDTGSHEVSLRVIYEEKAINQAAGFLADDPAGLGAVLDAVDRLADDPRPGRVVPVRVAGPAAAAGRPVPGAGRDQRRRGVDRAHRPRDRQRLISRRHRPRDKRRAGISDQNFPGLPGPLAGQAIVNLTL
jgi:hypothetical protein